MSRRRGACEAAWHSGSELAYQLYWTRIHGGGRSRRAGSWFPPTAIAVMVRTASFQPPDPKSSVHKSNVPATCGQCHAGVLKIWAGSIHGQLAGAGNDQAPVRIDCHTSHEIRRVEMDAWKLEVVRECGSCHTQSLRTYHDTSITGDVARIHARPRAARTVTGSHDILPVSDPGASRGTPGRNVTTCEEMPPFSD